MRMKLIWKLVRVAILAILLATLFRSYLFASYVVDGKSMEPTLHDGNLLMVNKLVYDLQDIDRFDVVVFHANQREDYVKRVIGVPGDQLAYRGDQLYINEKQIEEDFLEPFRKDGRRSFTGNFTLKEITGKQTVPDGKLFVMGDNRRESLDSRSFGFVPIDAVVGKVDVRYWPISKASIHF